MAPGFGLADVGSEESPPASGLPLGIEVAGWIGGDGGPGDVWKDRDFAVLDVGVCEEAERREPAEEVVAAVIDG